MIKQLFSNIVHRKYFSTIIYSSEDTKEWLDYSKSVAHKGELDIIERARYSSIESLVEKEKITEKTYIILTNASVLEKVIPEVVEDTATAFQRAFPNVSQEDFYVETLAALSQTYVYICRKAYLDDILSEYEQHNIIITGWSLGPIAIKEIVPFIPESYPTIEIPNYTIIRKAQEILSISKNATHSHKTYTIGGTSFKDSDLLAFSGAVRSYSNYLPEATSNFSPETKKRRKLFKQHRFFKLGVPLTLGILLIVFLGNTFAFNHYFKQVDTLEQKTQIHIVQKNNLIQMDSIVTAKEKRFDNIVAASTSSVSLYVDQIAATTPVEMLLTTLNYQPLKKKIRTTKLLDLDYGKMTIQGETRSKQSLSTWITVLESLDFIKNVVVHLENDKGITAFTLFLNLK